MNPQEYSLNIRPGAGYAQTVKVSQGDIGRPLRFNLLDGAEALGIQAGTSITIHGTKPSGLGFTNACTWSGSVASVTTTLEMTQENGTFPAELVLTLGNDVIGTANFTMNVERSPHDENVIDGTYDVADSIFARMDALEEGLDTTNEEVARVAATVPAVDATLTVSGAAADAKKTGDEITQLKADLNEPRDSKNNKLSLSLKWEQGAYNPNSGGGSSSNTRIRSPYFVPFKGFIRFTVPDGYKLFWYRYDYWNYASISGHSGTWKMGTVQINDDGRLYKIALAKSDDSTIRPADAPTVGVEIGGKANTLTPSNTDYLNTEILSILSVYSTMRIPHGVFTLTAPITLADNQAIIGDGFGSVLRLANNVSDSAIKLASNNIIQNLQIVGGSDDYTVDTAPSTMGTRHGILFTGSAKRGIIENCYIHGFDGFAIYCYNTSTASNQGMSIKGCYLVGNHGGFYARTSEFHRISGIDCNNCYIGAEIDGGNITVNGSNFSSNQIGLNFDNEDESASNNTHGEVVGCIIQHSRQSAVKINNMASGEMFVGCNIDNGGVSLIKACRILFSGCNFMNAFSIDITDGGLIHFADCMIRDYTKEHTTVTNNTAVKFTNCFDVSGNLFNPVA